MCNEASLTIDSYGAIHNQQTGAVYRVEVIYNDGSLADVRDLCNTVGKLFSTESQGRRISYLLALRLISDNVRQKTPLVGISDVTSFAAGINCGRMLGKFEARFKAIIRIAEDQSTGEEVQNSQRIEEHNNEHEKTEGTDPS